MQYNELKITLNWLISVKFFLFFTPLRGLRLISFGIHTIIIIIKNTKQENHGL